jgi:Cu/Ag efflux protein CusF
MPLRGNMTFFGSIAALTVISCLASAQTQPAAPRSQVSGTVAAVDAAANKISLKSDKGDAVDVTTTDRTLVLRIPPGETDPKKGTKIALSTVAPGDRAVIVGPAPAGNAWNATAVLVMTKGDIASVQQKDQEDWKKRGTTGTVTALDPATKSITIKSGSHTFAVQPSEKTTWNRYSPDSARFADAKPSSFAEVKQGDQLRVLGNKNEDGASIQAEKIVFGAFRQIAATISSVDAAKGELTVKDLATKKPLTIKVESDSTMKKLPEQAARMLARRYAPGAAAEASAPPAGAGRGGRGGGDVGGMLDQLPALPLTELKPGDAIMISTTQGSDPGRVTLVMLLAGVEPLLTASPTATRDIMSGWNLGGGGGDSGQ